jgi:hypothetical protein
MYYITKAGRDLLEDRQHGRSTPVSLAAGHQAAAEIAAGQPEKAKISIARGQKEVRQRGRVGSEQRKIYIRSGKKIAPQRSSDKRFKRTANDSSITGRDTPLARRLAVAKTTGKL